MINYSISDKKNKLLKLKKIDFNDAFNQVCSLTCKILNINDDLFFDINIVSKRRIRKINKKYRKVNNVTDVISFAFCDNPEIKTHLLGEIFICYDIAKKQSLQYSHSIYREIIFLLIHGLLHLLGYSHNNKKEEQNMLKLSKDIINNITLPIDIVRK